MSISKNRPIQIVPEVTGQAIGSSGETINSPGEPIVGIDRGERSPGNSNNLRVVPVENENPLKSRISNSPSRNKIRILIRVTYKLFRKHILRQYDSEELALMNDKKIREKIQKQLTKEAKACEQRMANRLFDMGLGYTIKTEKGHAKEIRKVKFSSVQLEPNALWFKVSIPHLPHGVSTDNLISEEVTRNLSFAVGHKVQCRWDPEAGLWFIVERASGRMGIPNHVNLVDLWERKPKSRDNLSIPVGLGQNSKPIWESLDDMVHLLIAGTTGGGKSNFLNVILCTLIKFNSPDRLKLLLVDLKGGLEFNFYKGIPHLLPNNIAPNGIVETRELVPPLLNWVITLGEKRMEILKAAGYKSIGQYNHHKKKDFMPHIVFVIDEWADVVLDPETGKDAERALANNVQRMRAVGIHCIICTQTPNSNTISGRIKANLPARFAFSCASLQGSMAIIDNGAAKNLQPKGRCLFIFQNEILVQTPFIPDTLIKSIVAGSINGKAEVIDKLDVTEEEVRKWAIHENSGWLSVNPTFNQFKDRGLTKEQLISWLQSWDGQEFLIGSSSYQVLPGEGSRGRRLIVVEDDKPETPQP